MTVREERKNIKKSLYTPTILRGLRVAIGILLLVFALKGANWIELRKSLTAANLTWLLLALGVVVIGRIAS